MPDCPLDQNEPADESDASSAGRRANRPRPGVLAAIALGGMVGATARYQLTQALPAEPGRLPWATLWTNLSGSFALGLFLALVLGRVRTNRYLRPFVATGVLGAFTTMSTCLVETALLIDDGHLAAGLGYSLASLVIGLALAYTGLLAGRRLASRPSRRPPGYVA